VGLKSKIVIIGGGPGGYESALVAAQLGADVTVVDDAGLGGAAVLTDAVPSKTLIATADQGRRAAVEQESDPADVTQDAGLKAAAATERISGTDEPDFRGHAIARSKSLKSASSGGTGWATRSAAAIVF
jgi:pyruvate/2-oxoglutarate dehydrogenase complex dihydrolipoamide dehydrogenase (E3) component